MILYTFYMLHNTNSGSPENQTTSEASYKASLARQASRTLAQTSDESRTAALEMISAKLRDFSSDIIEINQLELSTAREKGLSESFLDRMMLNDERIEGMASGVSEVAGLEDPIGGIEDMSERPNGLKVGKMRIPIGVLASVYEARPNVTIDIAAIAIKSGNAVVLRSGSDAHKTSSILAEIARNAVSEAGIDIRSIQFIESTDREEVDHLLAAEEFIDLMVPRGGSELIARVRDNAKMPVVAGGIGVCHTYVDGDADFEMAGDIVLNAKTRRPSVCNTLDTLLVDRSAAAEFIPLVSQRLADAGVNMHVEPETITLLPVSANVLPLQQEDYDTEWLSLDCSIRVVDGLAGAIEHIAQHGSGHSEAIVTSSSDNSKTFLAAVDASAVFVNASTGFNDGGEFGLGCELGISTQKMHARGPMGLKELTSYKWIVLGEGHTRP